MNRRLALAVPAAAVLVGLGTLATPAFAADGAAPYATTSTAPTPTDGAIGPQVTGPSAAGPEAVAPTGTVVTTVAVAPSSAVSPTSVNSGGALPFTGSESLLVLGLAAGALTTGVVLVGLGRRRATS